MIDMLQIAVLALVINNPGGITVEQWPITTGVPFPPGVLQSADQVRLLDEAGKEMAVQVACTGVHEDGSVRWLMLDFQADVPEAGRTLALEFAEGVTRTEPPAPLQVQDAPGAITVNTGPLEFAVNKTPFNGFDVVTLDGSVIIKPGHEGGPYFVDDEGNEFRACLDPEPEVTIESQGPMRTVITARGWYCNDAGEKKCRFIVRVHAYAGKPYVRVFYTWLMTEDSRELRFHDIGFRIPMESDGCGFPLDDGTLLLYSRPVNYTAHLVQYDFDKFRPLPDEAREGGPQPLGLINSYGQGSTIALAVRDFRQLFPKELSYTPQGLTFHTWPGHGVPNPDRKVEDAMLQYLWFCHEGEVLDFQVPESYYSYEGEHSHNDYRYLRSSQNANAIGIAKTHELLISFCVSDVEATAACQLNAAFQDPPVCMATPEWMCESGVFGAMQPCSPDLFPEYEAMMAGTFDAERRMQEFTRDYGMWNFGDSHTSWDTGRRRWNDVYRSWRNTHHGCCRLPWLLYFRSGAPKYLKYGIRNARHVLDEDFCHWTNEEFEPLDYPHGKIKGALNDYKGIVHWHSGNRLMDYNAMTDFALWYWHMTGDRWGLEVALDWGEAVKERWSKPRGSRSGTGTLSALIELYKETLDERYREIIEACFEHLTTKVQNVDGTQEYSTHVTHYWPQYEGKKIPAGAFPEWENYAPWLERYWELTRNPAAEKATVMWADAYLEGFGDLCSMWGTGDYTNILAYAYLFTGDEKYLARGVWEANRAVQAVYRGDDELLQGLMQLGQTSHGGYVIQRLPFFLKALAQHGKPVEPDPLFRSGPGFQLLFERTRPVIDGKPSKIETVEAWLLEDRDREFTVTLHTNHSYEERTYTIVVLSPSGKEAAKLVDTYPKGNKDLVVTVPADGEAGVYRLTCAAQGSYGAVSTPIEVKPEMPVAFPLASRIIKPGGAQYFFFVPKDLTKLAVSMRAVNPGMVSAQVTSPDGETRVYFTKGSDAKAVVGCEVEPKADQTGAVWKLNLGGDACNLSFVSEGADIPQILFQEAYPAEVCRALADALKSEE